jgi:hypothetical protein
MTFEFIFDETVYKYEDGDIYYKTNYGGSFLQLCPVLNELNILMETFDNNQRIVIMEALVHSCLAGYRDGKKAKIREFKNLFDLY